MYYVYYIIMKDLIIVKYFFISYSFIVLNLPSNWFSEYNIKSIFAMSITISDTLFIYEL